MDKRVKEYTKDDVTYEEFGYTNEDGECRYIITIHQELEQFEIAYANLYSRLEIELKDVLYSTGFHIKNRNFTLHTEYLSENQLKILISEVIDCMNGIVKAHNMQIDVYKRLTKIRKEIIKAM